MKKNLLLAALVLVFIGSFAQDRLTPELLWKIGRISDPQISPDGKTVLFAVTKYVLEDNRGYRDLYTMPVTGGEATQITATEDNEYNALWRPDGKKIGFLTSRGGSMQLWESGIDGKYARQITNYEGGISNFNYSPDGKYISFSMDVKLDQTVNDLYPDLPKANARIIDDLMYRHWNQWSDYTYSHVCYAEYNDGKPGEVVDIMKDEKFDSPLKPFGGGEQIAWTADSRSIAYTSKKLSGKNYAVSTNSDIYLYDILQKTTKNLTEGMNGYDMEPAFSPDGNKMAWLSMQKDGFEADKNRIFVMDLKTGKKDELTIGFDQTCSGLAWANDNRYIYCISDMKGTKQVFRADSYKGEMKQITEGTHNYNSVMVAGEMLIGSRNSMSYPAEFYLVDPATGKQTQFSHTNDDLLKNMKWGEVKERWVTTTDDKKMLAWVIYPPDFDPSKKYPTLLYCQGGPQSAVSQFFSYRWNFQLMAAKGYIVVAPNRRGLPGFGQKWNDDISTDWGGQAIKDYLSAIDDVSKEAYVDNARLGAVGASYGGYSVYYLAGHHKERFKCFISHCGLFNLESWYGATEEMFFANWDLGGSYWNNPQPKSYEQFSPHKFVQNWDTPILVIHNEKDFRVPVTEGMQAFTAAKLQNIPARFLYYPEEGHWVLGPQNGVLWHRVFFEWLDLWLE